MTEAVLLELSSQAGILVGFLFALGILLSTN